MGVRLMKTTGEVLNIDEQEIDRYVGKHNATIVKPGMKFVVDSNGLVHGKRWNEHASKLLEHYVGHPCGIYGDAAVIEGPFRRASAPSRPERVRDTGSGSAATRKHA